MRILYVTTIGSTMNFFKLLIRSLLDEGHIVDIATNEDKKVPTYYSEWGCKVYPISCVRSPFKKNNVKAIKQIRQIVDKNNYDLVHCHTPIASICARLACRPLRKKGIKVIYTAHGFHFYKGAPLINWFIYYPLDYYKKELEVLEGISFMPINDWNNPNCWLSCIFLSGKIKPIDIILKLEVNNIETRPIWKPMHLQPFHGKYDYIGTGVSEIIFNNGLCLPSDTKMTDEQLNKICNIIKELWVE